MKTKIIYITGLSRSGSTILDMILGAHPNGVGLGEVRQVLALDEKMFVEKLANRRCSCGAKPYDCVCWGDYLNWLSSNLNNEKAKKYEHLISHVKDIYSDNHFFIDSSKSRDEHLLELSTKFDIRLIQLVRDIRPFLFSQQALHGKSLFWWVAYWWIGNRRREAYSKKFSHHLTVGHDELVMEPEMILRKICEFIGIEYSASMLSPANSNSHVLFGNTVSGDKLKASRIRYDYRWLLDGRNVAIQHPFLAPLMHQNKKWVYSNLFEGEELKVFSSSRRKEIKKLIR